jgi:hypothetical protein
VLRLREIELCLRRLMARLGVVEGLPREQLAFVQIAGPIEVRRAAPRSASR